MLKENNLLKKTTTKKNLFCLKVDTFPKVYDKANRKLQKLSPFAENGRKSVIAI